MLFSLQTGCFLSKWRNAGSPSGYFWPPLAVRNSRKNQSSQACLPYHYGLACSLILLYLYTETLSSRHLAPCLRSSLNSRRTMFSGDSSPPGLGARSPARKPKRTQQDRDKSPTFDSNDVFKRHKGAETQLEGGHWGLPSSLSSTALLSFQNAASRRKAKLVEAGLSSTQVFTSCLLATRRTAPTKVSTFDWSFSRQALPHLSQHTLGAAYVIRNELSNLLLEGYNLSEAVKVLSHRLGEEIDPSVISLQDPLLHLVNIDPPPHLTGSPATSSGASSIEGHSDSSNKILNISENEPIRSQTHSSQPELSTHTSIDHNHDSEGETGHDPTLNDAISPVRTKRPSQDMKRHEFDLHTLYMPESKRSCLTDH